MKYLSLSWLKYHLLTLLQLIIVFHPFRIKSNRLPIVLIPYGAIPTFLFALVSSLLIYLPLVLFIGLAINANILAPELFIVSAFGLIFGTIFRSIQGKSISHIHVYRHELILTFFGFYEKEVEIIRRDKWEGLVLYKEKYRSTKNFKVCLQLDDGRQVMLELTIFGKRAKRKLYSLGKILKLKEINPQQMQIINDGHVHLGN